MRLAGCNSAQYRVNVIAISIKQSITEIRAQRWNYALRALWLLRLELGILVGENDYVVKFGRRWQCGSWVAYRMQDEKYDSHCAPTLYRETADRLAVVMVQSKHYKVMEQRYSKLIYKSKCFGNINSTLLFLLIADCFYFFFSQIPS